MIAVIKSAGFVCLAVLLPALLFLVEAQTSLQKTKAAQRPLKEVQAKAEAGDAKSEFELGRRFSTGAGVPKDPVEGVKWFRKAAEQNLAEAQYLVGFCFYAGAGVAKDQAEAVKWFRKAAEQNHPEAQNNLGLCFANGEGVAKDLVEAVKWYRKAAEQNDAEAQHNLGACFYAGAGVAKDQTQAVKWFRKAAEQNDAKAQYNLGVCYTHGEGVAKDLVEAAKWYRKAAEQNYFKAQYNLGFCYYEGQGVAKDPVEAYKWLLLAARQGNKTAQNTMIELKSYLTREQIAEGEKRAGDFNPNSPFTSAETPSMPLVTPASPTMTARGFNAFAALNNANKLLLKVHVSQAISNYKQASERSRQNRWLKSLEDDAYDSQKITRADLHDANEKLRELIGSVDRVIADLNAVRTVPVPDSEREYWQVTREHALLFQQLTRLLEENWKEWHGSGIQPKTGETKPWQEEADRLRGEIDKLNKAKLSSTLL
jgi:TPR repeat protein